MNPILQNMLATLSKAKAYPPGKITACCPAHDDKNPSFSAEEKDGKILVYCHAGCPQEVVLRALGDWGIELHPKGQTLPISAQSPKQRSPLFPPIAATEKDLSPPDFEKLLRCKPEFIYTYRNATDDAVFGYMCRWSNSDGQKVLRPISPHPNEFGQTTWQTKAMAEPRPLYGLDILYRHPEKPVLVVEGEKTADAARTLPDLQDHVVVTWSGGANASLKTDWTPLKNRTVIIWPDNDAPGKKAATNILTILKEINHA